MAQLNICHIFQIFNNSHIIKKLNHNNIAISSPLFFHSLMNSSPNFMFDNQYTQQFNIPSFNPSLSSSRKSKQLEPTQSYNLFAYNDREYNEPMQNFNKKARIYEQQYAIQSIRREYPEEFWAQLYEQEEKIYKILINKYNLLQQSIQLHRQTLKLRNQEYVDGEQRIQQIQTRIKNLNNQSKSNDNKIKQISQQCLATKTIINEIYKKMQSEQVIIVQQQKHTMDIEDRIQRMKEEIEGLEIQLNDITDKQRIFEELEEENEELEEFLDKVQNQVAFAKVKMDKSNQEEENMAKKMKDLEKVIGIRQKNNRELGKKLVQMKKLNPQLTLRNKSPQKQQTLPQIIKNIRQMQYEYGKIQQQIYQLSQKIETTSDKTRQKIKSIDILKLRYQKTIADFEQNGQQNIQLTFNQNKQKSIIASPAKQQNFQLKSNRQTNNSNSNNEIVNKKPIGYRVIESQQNQQIIYPKTTNNANTFNKNNYAHSFQNSHSNTPSPQEIQITEEDVSQSNQEKTLQMTQSIKNLLTRYEKIKNNSKFKHS